MDSLSPILPDDMIRLIVDSIAADATDEEFYCMCTRLLCKSQVLFVRDMQHAASSSLFTITVTHEPTIPLAPTTISWHIDYLLDIDDPHNDRWHSQLLADGSWRACCRDCSENVVAVRAKKDWLSGCTVTTLRFPSSVRQVFIYNSNVKITETCAIHVHSFGICTRELTIYGGHCDTRVKLPSVLPDQMKAITIRDCRVSSGPEFWSISRLAATHVLFQDCELHCLPSRLRSRTVRRAPEHNLVLIYAYTFMEFVAVFQDVFGLMAKAIFAELADVVRRRPTIGLGLACVAVSTLAYLIMRIVGP